MRVIVCDDEPDIRQLYRMAFEAAGADVVEAVDGDDCVARCRECAPDLVALDLYMPVRDGLSALPEIKACCPDARVVIVSAHGSDRVFDKGRALGASACFDKPGFLSRIPRLVERYG